MRRSESRHTRGCDKKNSQSLQACFDQQSFQRRLNNRQILPLAVDRLQLVHPAVIGMEKIAAVRNRVMMRRTDGAPGPPATARSSPAAAMLSGFLGEFDAVLHFIFDTGQACRNQPPTALQLFFAHGVIRRGQPVKGFACPPSLLPVNVSIFCTTMVAHNLIKGQHRFRVENLYILKIIRDLLD
jgi:hypothetical protein